jgi:hypothetical protein
MVVSLGEWAVLPGSTDPSVACRESRQRFRFEADFFRSTAAVAALKSAANIGVRCDAGIAKF